MSFIPRIWIRGAAGPRRRAAAVGAVAAALLGLSACASAAGANSPAGNGQSFVSGTPGVTEFGSGGPVAPDVSAATLTGAKLSLSAYRGHVVVLNFWGSWCAPCRAEAPTLSALARKFAPSGVKFVGANIRDTVAGAQAFDRDFGITYPSWNDPGDEIALEFRSTVPPEGIPTTLVISPDGRITGRIIGEASYSALSRLVTTAARPS